MGLKLVFEVSLLQLTLFGTIIHCIGIYALLVNKRNLLMLLMAAELALLGVVMNLAVFSVVFTNPMGQVYALLVLVTAAAESSIGLALVIL